MFSARIQSELISHIVFTSVIYASLVVYQPKRTLNICDSAECISAATLEESFVFYRCLLLLDVESVA